MLDAMSQKVSGEAPVRELIQDNRHGEHAACKLVGASALVAGQLPHNPAVVIGDPSLRAVLWLSACRMKQRCKVSCSYSLAVLSHHLHCTQVWTLP